MGLLQPEHLILILVLVLIVFGAGKLPSTMSDLGRGVRAFRAEADSKTAPTTQTDSPPTATKCVGCGTPATVGAKFCANCGRAF